MSQTKVFKLIWIHHVQSASNIHFSYSLVTWKWLALYLLFEDLIFGVPYVICRNFSLQNCQFEESYLSGGQMWISNSICCIIFSKIYFLSISLGDWPINDWGMPCVDVKFKYSLYSFIGLSIIFTNPSAWAGYDTRSIFKWSLTGLNSEFSFSETSRLTKAEEPSLPYYFTHSWRENNWIHTFPKGISAMWNAISLIQDLNSSRHVHFLWR